MLGVHNPLAHRPLRGYLLRIRGYRRRVIGIDSEFYLSGSGLEF
jgi:hypothetical protein